MNQENRISAGTLALTFLAGAAVGAVVLVLTTPKTGKEVREDLKKLRSCLGQKTREVVDASEMDA